MRLALLCAAALLLAAAPTAQTTDLDRRIDRLERQIAALTAELDALRAERARFGGGRLGGGGLGSGTEAELDAERIEFQDAIRAYQADAEAYRAGSERVRGMYDDLVRYGGSRADRAAYEDALLDLEDEGRRLEGEARMLNEWNAELNARYRDLAPRRAARRY